MMEKIFELNGVPVYGTISSEIRIKSFKKKLEKNINKLYYKGDISINAYYELIKICK